MTINLQQNVKQIIETIEAAGFEAYAVGGCVRDTILGRIPDDWDITTSASPEEVKSLFRRTVDTGTQHGTVTILLGSEQYEVTTYRIDGKYEDGRHPSEVTFTKSLKEDLLRRDFTINAMAYNERDGLIDLYNGMGDIEKKVIRCVGDPIARFSEDALRMMRAVRFSAQLGYSIEDQTFNAVSELAPSLQKISAERIRVELCKILTSDHPEYLETLYTTGMTKVFLPEFDVCMETEQNNPHHMYSVGKHILVALQHSPADITIRLALLLHDIAKPVVKTTDEKGIDHFYSHQDKGEELAGVILRRLKFDNDTISITKKLVKYHDYRIETSPKAMRHAVNKVGKDIFPTLLTIMQCDILAQSSYQREEKNRKLDYYNQTFAEIISKDDCVSIKDLAVKGKDLIDIGFHPGPEIGNALETMLNIVLDNPELNDKDTLIKLYREREPKL